MKKIEYGTEFLDQLKDSVHDLYDRNKELLSSNVKLREEKLRLNNIIDKAIEYCKELMLFKKNSRQYLIGKCMLEILGGVDKE